MSAVAAAAAAAAEMATFREAGIDPGRFEHLHLHLVRTHWATKHHENLGCHLQEALDTLDKEGWEVVTAFVSHTQVPEVILRRWKRPADHGRSA